MKILLFNPPKVDGMCVMREEMTYGRCNQDINPFDIAILSAVFKGNGYHVELYDCQGIGLDSTGILDRIDDFRPDWIITQSTFASYQEDARLFKKIGERSNAKIVCSFVPRLTKKLAEIFLNDSSVDYLVIDEPYYTPFELVSKGETDGLAYMTGNKFVFSQKEKFMNINDLPVADYRSLPMGEYDLIHIDTLRDCPYKCTFCTHSSPERLKQRGYYTAERLFDEFKAIYENGGKRIDLGDSNPFLYKKRLTEFCNLIIENKVDIKWECNGRVGTEDYDLVKLMKRAGCYSIVFGIESGSDEMLKTMGKGITVSESITAVNVLRELNMPISYHLIIGLPGETEETINDTIDFINKTKPDNFSVNIATPFPGTKFYDYCIVNGLCREEDFFSKEFDHRTKQSIKSDLNLPREKRRIIKSIKFRPWYIKNKLMRWVRGEYPSGVTQLVKSGIDIIKNR